VIDGDTIAVEGLHWRGRIDQQRLQAYRQEL
jgi:hypothetical protein